MNSADHTETAIDTAHQKPTTTPVVLLDVDGVLNIDRFPWGTPCAIGRAISASGVSYRIRWAPTITERLAVLHTRGTVELRWASTWNDHNPHQFETLMGLPHLQMAFPADPNRPEANDYRARYRTAKLTAALNVVRIEHRPLAWLDDDAIIQWGHERDELTAVGALLIVPNERFGLTSEHLDTLYAYAARGRRDL